MRISELSEQSGVSIPTIKFYLREGLLAPGVLVTKTQSAYDETHLRRLRLVRALRDVAGLPIASIADVMAAVDSEAVSLLDLLGVTQVAVSGVSGDTSARGLRLAEEFIAELGWRVATESPLMRSLGRLLEELADRGIPITVAALGPWASAAHSVAAVEVAGITADMPRDQAAEIVAMGTPLFGELLSQLRLAAQESESRRRFGQ
ncbi:MAG: MerR family transcriptional regulator [Frankiales bacterium]|nr:MerR family transcriptional regulator [Frankiales bacterium]